jgi:hypothetical protein
VEIAHAARLHLYKREGCSVYSARMNISGDRLREFIRIYKDDFGEDISPGEAQLMIGRLLALYELLARPLPSELLKEKQSSGEVGDFGDVVEGKPPLTQPRGSQDPHASPSAS